MPKYKYEATSMSGETTEGTFEVGSKNDVIAMLKQRGYYATTIEQIDIPKDVKELKLFAGKVTKKALAVFCQQFGTIIEAGVPMIQALQIMVEQTKNKRLMGTLRQIYDQVQTGVTLSDSMKRSGDIFPPILIYMIEAGEISGTLDDALLKMAVHFEKSYKLEQKVRNTMTYPAIVSVAAVGVVWFLLVKVVPTFVGLFQNAGAELPVPTRILLSLSEYMQKYGIVTFVGLVLLVILLRMAASRGEGRMLWHRFLLKLPAIGGYQISVLTSRFTRSMSTLVSTGVPLEQALQVVAKILNNAVGEAAVQSIISDVNMGASLESSLKKTHFFPSMVRQMVAVGETTGALETMLGKTADYYEAEVEASVQRLTTLLEPAIIVVLGGIVAFVVLSIMLPIFDMYNLVG